MILKTTNQYKIIHHKLRKYISRSRLPTSWPKKSSYDETHKFYYFAKNGYAVIAQLIN